MKRAQEAQEKVVVIYRLGVSDSWKERLWKAFGDVYLKPVRADASSLQDEFEYKKQATWVVCLPEVSDEAENLAKQWPYEARFLVLGQPARKVDSIEYAESIEKWKRRQKNKEQPKGIH